MVKKLSIAFSTDDRGVEMMLVVIFSIMKHHLPEMYHVSIFVIESGLEQASKRKIATLSSHFPNLKIKYLSISGQQFESFKLPQAWISHQAYYRYLLPDLLPKENKILYLDIDLLCRGTLDNLYELDISGYYVAAVPSYAIDNSTSFFVGYKKSLGMTDNETYFNSGVLLMNLDKMRHEDKVKEFLFNAGENRFNIMKKEDDKFVDQTVANITFRSGVRKLSYRWNALVHSPHTHTDHPVLLHFAGLHKPFSYADTRPEVIKCMDEYTGYYVECMSVVNQHLSLESMNQMLTKRLKDLYLHISESNKEISQLKHARDMLLNSVSWKITGPLRMLKKRLKS